MWPWFERWVSNCHQSVGKEWEAISDKRRFFVDLVLCAIFDYRSDDAKPHRERAKSISPEIFRRVVPVLRRRIKGSKRGKKKSSRVVKRGRNAPNRVILEDYLAVIRNPDPRDHKWTPRQYDKRAKVRKGLETLPNFLPMP